MTNIQCSMNNCLHARGRLLVEGLIAFTFKNVLKVIIETDFSSTCNDKANGLDFIDALFFLLV